MKPYFELLGEVKHLSEEQIEQLYQRYLAGEKTSDLIAEYKIPVAVRSLLTVLPPLLDKQLKCPYCNLPMWAKRYAKGTPASLRPAFKCVRCEHRSVPVGQYRRHSHCTCTACYQVRQQEVAAQAERDREQLLKRYSPGGPPVAYASLGFVQKLALLALLEGFKPGNDSIAPLEGANRNESLAPSAATAEELLKNLYEAGVLRVDADSDIQAFDPGADYRIRRFCAVRWLPNVALDAGMRCPCDELYGALYQELSGVVPANWKSELYALIFSLAREESLSYIRVLAEEVDLVFSAASRGEAVIAQLLQDFAVSEIYYFAKLAVKNAAHFFATGNSKGRTHASNTIPGYILSTAQHALAEGWRRPSYRDSRVTKSALHRLLYDVVLKDSSAGFAKSPGVYWRDELLPRFFATSTGYEAGQPSAHLFCRECDSCNIDVWMDKVMLQTTCYDCATVSRFQAVYEVED